MASTSALGETLGGAAGLIDAVGNLLPTTTTSKGHTETKASANSDTSSGEFNIGKSSTIGSEKTSNKSSNASQNSTEGASREFGTNKSTTTSSGQSSENFSGQSNSTTTQTMLTDEGVMRIVNMMLQGTGGIPGLQETVSGERNAGVFNSSTNSLLSTNLVSTIAGEVARLSAPTVQTQNLGATNTQTNNNTSTLADAITSVMSSMNQSSASRETGSSSGQSSSQQDMLNMVLGLAQQLTEQESESVTDNKTKSKSGKCGFLAITSILMLPSYLTEMDTIRNFRDTYVAVHYPDQIPEYYKETTARVRALERLDMDSQYRVANAIFQLHYKPLVVAHKQGNNELAFSHYLSLLNKLDSIKGA